MRAPVKITVLKKLSAADVFGQPLEELSDDLAPVCDKLETGQEFLVEESGAMPAGFCSWAWHDIHREVTALRVGGNFPWIKKEGMIYSCCTDGARPVFFKIERI